MMFSTAMKYLINLGNRVRGYTIIELVAVSAIVLIVTTMAFGSVSTVRRFSMEQRAVTKLRQLADAQERYRYSSDPTINPDGTYASFEELQLTNFIANDYELNDIPSHTVNAFVPYYQLEIARSPNDILDEPDVNHYYIVLTPLANKWNLKTFYMIEDGEPWHTYGLRYYER